MAVYEFHTRIAYSDIDGDMKLTLRGAMGMMQEAAIIHSDTIDYSVRHIPQTHLIWMLVQWRVRMLASAQWNENVTVRTWPRTMLRATSDRDFEIVGEDGRKIAIGTSSWVLVSSDRGRIVRIPEEVAQAYDLTSECVFNDETPETPLVKGVLAYTGVVQRRDIDTNHHVNNRVYLQYAEEALGDTAFNAKEVFVRYKKQLLLGQKMQCYVQQDEQQQCVEIYTEDGVACAVIIYK